MPEFPPQGSTVASSVDLLFLALTGLASFFVFLVAGLITYFAVIYRRRSAAEVPRPLTGSNRLEFMWTIIPLSLALAVFFWAAQLYLQMIQPPPNALEIYVVGKEWMWQFEHANGQKEIDELHVPVGRPIKLTMISQDVIHSFYVPAFRVKQDVLPERYTTLWFQVIAPGRYHMFCAEYCGTDHARMTGWVIAMEPADFQTWLSGGAVESPASSGAQLFQQLGCNTCHRSDALGRAPMLEGVFGQPVPLESGEVVIADETYLRESILDPEAKIVAGYQPIMPSFRGQVSEQQLISLIAYIRSLSQQTTAVPPVTTPGAGTTTPSGTQPPGTVAPTQAPTRSPTP